MNGGLEKAIFKNKLPGVVNCSKLQIVKPDMSSSLLFEIYDTRNHFFEKMPFLDPHLFWLTSFFDDTYLVGPMSHTNTQPLFTHFL